MATFEECKTYFKCNDTQNLTNTEIIEKAIDGTPCPSKNHNTEGQTAELGRCKKICTHFKEMKKNDAIKMCRLSFRFSEEMTEAILNDEVEYSTIPFDGSQVFIPIQPSTYDEYKDIFDNYFIMINKQKFKKIKEKAEEVKSRYESRENDYDNFSKFKGIEEIFTFLTSISREQYKGLLLHKEVKSHKNIIDMINELIPHGTKCNEKGKVVGNGEGGYLICKKSASIGGRKLRSTLNGKALIGKKTLKKLTNKHSNCMTGPCWHKLSTINKRKPSVKKQIKELKSIQQEGGSRKQNRNINKSKKNSKKSIKNKKSKKNHKRSKNSNKK